MNALTEGDEIASAAFGARPSTPAERQAMQAAAVRLDRAMSSGDVSAIMALFAAEAVCEFKPAGLRITSRATIAELFRRSLPALAASFTARRQLREWSNQDGLLREWSYPVHSASGEEVPTTQLEIIEFAPGLEQIRSYRIRMNGLFSKHFVRSLGEDFAGLPGIVRVPG